ncbi:hypothetical protein [Ureibacillus aquaedulcis]|uniref:Uncharacterized protein n=1 Tax=Ureibacillus aquaedulcis TaxID=3058421 RepID=A0ABT8GT42_9BACL|nr:hypothetical protein [Ureibacillus sp. BA0131]MDN4494575.1 hypothetical protein [Ureibacillus sp. BA0131]
MSEVLEVEYRGLNILDEISTVEIALDYQHNAIHIYDRNEVVEPEFNFSTRKYELSEGFFKMAKVLYNKRFFEVPSQAVEQWIDERIWVFYGSKKSILKFDKAGVIEIPKDIFGNGKQIPGGHPLYNKYVLRVI